MISANKYDLIRKPLITEKSTVLGEIGKYVFEVERTAEKLFIPFTVGGGIGELSVIRDLLNAGADKISINSAAVFNPELISDASQRYGAQCIVVAVDAKSVKENGLPSPKPKDSLPIYLDSSSRWQVYTHGGRKPTGIDAVKWAAFMESVGAGEILLTSMDRDGTKVGYDIELTRAIHDRVKIPVIASGGAGQLSHITDVLEVSEAALLASLLHFRELTVDQIKLSCRQNGFCVR